jgi:hypothetical protein
MLIRLHLGPLVFAVAITVLACAPTGTNTTTGAGTTVTAEAEADPDVRAAGATGLPAGYLGRADRADASLADARYANIGNGWEITTGPAHILYSPLHNATGSYTVSSTIEQLARPRHPEAFGIFFGGRNLDGPNQAYTYFLVRGTGEMFVQRRAGDQLHRLIAWHRTQWVPEADAEGRATYRLQVQVRPDSVRFRVNDVVAAVLPNTPELQTDGIAGLRINHNLRVRATPVVVSRP